MERVEIFKWCAVCHVRGAGFHLLENRQENARGGAAYHRGELTFAEYRRMVELLGYRWVDLHPHDPSGEVL